MVAESQGSCGSHARRLLSRRIADHNQVCNVDNDHDQWKGHLLHLRLGIVLSATLALKPYYERLLSKELVAIFHHQRPSAGLDGLVTTGIKEVREYHCRQELLPSLDRPS